MRLPRRLIEALQERSPDDATRRRVILALLLRSPVAYSGPHRFRWRPPPLWKQANGFPRDRDRRR
jgi:hypothetical protein